MISCAKGLCRIALETWKTRQARGSGSLQLVEGSKNLLFLLGEGGNIFFMDIWVSLLNRGRTNQKKNPNHHDLNSNLRWYDYDIESRMETAVLLQMLQLSSLWRQKKYIIEMIF